MTPITREIEAICAGFRAPPMPTSLKQLVNALGDPNTGTPRLEKIIVTDPGLVMCVLKTVNAAAFGLPSRIGDIRQAIVLLGVPTVCSLATGFMVNHSLGGGLGLSQAFVKQAWQKALRDAACVRAMGRVLPPDQDQAAFLAAICQHVGHLMLARHYGPRYHELWRKTPFPRPEVEQAMFGVDHATAGAAVLKQWRFPPEIIDAHIEHHDHETDHGIARILGLARMLLDGLAIDPEMASRPVESVDPKLVGIMGRLGLTWEELAEVLDQLDTHAAD